jgi:hypothetical protein
MICARGFLRSSGATLSKRSSLLDEDGEDGESDDDSGDNDDGDALRQ